MLINSPLVSICIPTRNGEKFLPEALSSVVAQSYKNIEVIFSDDASVDNTIQIISKFQKTFSKPVYLYHHNPVGIGANWNNCVRYANGELIKFLFQDDLLEPDCIEEMVKPFLMNKDLGLVFSRRKIIFDQTNPAHMFWVGEYKDLHLSWKNLKKTQKGKLLLKDPGLLEQPRNKVGEPTNVLLHRNVFERCGYFNPELKQALDYEFWYRIFARFDVSFIDHELASFRLHDTQATNVNAKNGYSDLIPYLNSLYKNLFFYLDKSIQRELFYRFNSVGRLILRVKGRFLQ